MGEVEPRAKAFDLRAVSAVQSFDLPLSHHVRRLNLRRRTGVVRYALRKSWLLDE